MEDGRVGPGGIRAVLLDLDGTVYEGSAPVPGAAEAVARLRGAGVAVRFTTNTDSTTPGVLVRRLSGMGVPACEEDLVTPVVVAARLFAASEGARVLAIAAPSVRAALGGCLVRPGERPTHVLVADPGYGAGYEDMDTAFRAVRAGADLVATQVGRIARRDDGEHLDTGGWVRLLEYATGVEARVLGKPSVDFFTRALDGLGVPAHLAAVVGDDPASDVAGARAVGALAVRVRTGKGRRLPPGADHQEDLLLDSVAELPGAVGC